MITDMVGYTRLSQRDEARALRLLGEHNGVIRDSVAAHGGREVKNMGDGFFVEFPSALQAVSCSIDIQRRLCERNAKAAETDRFHVRIGLHVGDVVHRNGDVFGDGVNITSRIEPLALPGGVCLSQTVQAQVWNKIDRPLQSLGAKELKNIDLPMEVFRVVLPWDEKEEEKAAERTKALDRTRLAVLPLVNISQDPDDVYFGDGMTEELIYTLSRIQGLHVIAQTSVMAYRGTKKTVREIGRELKVGSILEGSVRKAGERVRITIQLIDVQTEEHLWAERYDRELADVFEIQSEISTEVAKGLKTLLRAAVEAKAVEKPTDRLDAYTDYLKGRHFWKRRTRTALLRALGHFECAIEADPNFAKAHSGIADCYTVLANHGYQASEVALPKAKDAAIRALEIDPGLAEAHASLGIAYLQFESDIRAAEKEFEKAIRLNPSYATARQWYSGALHAQMRYGEALEHALKAIELDPMAHIMYVNAASILSHLGRYEDAGEHYRRAVELEPDYEATYAELARTDMALWNWWGAKQTLAEALDRNPNNSEALICKADLLVVLGEKEEALSAMREALAVAPDSGHVKDHAAQVLRSAGRVDEAIELYEQLRREMGPKPWTALMLSFAYIDVGRLDDARRHVEETEAAAKSLLPELRFWYPVVRGLIEAKEGAVKEARRQLAEVARYEQILERHTARAMILFTLGDVVGAYESLEEGIAVHDPLLAELPSDPIFAPHRLDPRFQRILGVMGLARVAEAV